MEENILAKSRQKAHLNDMVLQDGNFNTEVFQSWGAKEVKSLFDKPAAEAAEGSRQSEEDKAGAESEDVSAMETGDSDGAAASKPAAAAGEEVDVLEVQEAMASVEDESDTLAAKKAERESAAQY